MKRVFLLALGLLLLCFPLIGCDSKDGLAAEEIAKIVKGAGENGEPDSLSFDMNIEVDISIAGGSQSISMEMDADSIGTIIDNKNKELYMPLTMKTSFFGMSEEETAEIYIVNEDEDMGWAYMYVEGEDGGEGSWTKAELTTEIWEQQTQILPMEQIIDILDMDLELFDIESDSTGAINGVNCNILELKPDMEKLAEYVSQQEDIGDFDISGLEEILTAFSVDCKYWIAEESYRLMKVSLVLKGAISSDDLPEELAVEDFGNISVDLTAEIIFDYSDVSIPDLPAGAESAVPGDIEIPFSIPFF